MAARMARAPVPSADLQRQLATLLGKEAQDIGNIRKTDEIPPRISVIDVAALIANKDKNQAAEDFRRLTVRYPDVKANCFDVKFPDSRGRRGQKATPVTGAQGIVEIIMLLGGGGLRDSGPAGAAGGGATRRPAASLRPSG